MFFGAVKLARVRDSSDLREMFKEFHESEIVIIKPNWFSLQPANFIEVDVLRIILEALNTQVVVTEGYTLEKNDGSMKFTIDGDDVSWNWVIEHPSWDWIKEEGRWNELRRQDQWFLDEYGFTDLFQEFGVEYVNVTEEIWRGEIVDPAEVKKEVEARYMPAFTDQIYSFLPKRLNELRGSPLISLGKVKGIGGNFPSLTVKNLFGFIPDPLRSWWHGYEDKRLARSIIDITKVYEAYFEVYGVCEAISTVMVNNPEGEYNSPWSRYDILRELGIIICGPNLVQLDAIICGLIGIDPRKVSYIEEGEKAFGEYDRRHVEAARRVAHEWFHI
jgi:uncharacterized protein (DUF362 family)